MKNIKLKYRNLIQLLIAVLIIVLINILASGLFKRLDLTSEKRYTLSDYTKNLLENMDQQIYLQIFLEGDDLPIHFKRMKVSVKELLDEFKIYAGNNIHYEFVNPNDEDLEQEEKYMMWSYLSNLGLVPYETYDVEDGQTVSSLVFAHAVLTYSVFIPEGTFEGVPDTMITLDAGINLLNDDSNFSDLGDEENINNSIQALEYKFINEINKISRSEKPTVAFIEGHGELSEIECIEMSTILSEYYTVLRGSIDSTYGILDDFEAIIIAKPTIPFSENDKFVIDQYIMNGGKVLWLVEGVNANMDSIYLYNQTFAMPSYMYELNLEDQLFNYGARVNSNLITDYMCSSIYLEPSSTATGEVGTNFPWFYFPILITNNNHSINKYLNVMRTEFISSVDSVGSNTDVKKEILLTTSAQSKVLSITIPYEITFDSETLVQDMYTFNSGNQVVGSLLEGNFESNYVNRNISEYIPDKSLFKEKSEYTKMIVVGDGDIIKNVYNSKGESYPLDFDKYSQLWGFYGNEEFILNALNYLCDDEGLMEIRSRELKLRLLNTTLVEDYKTIVQFVNILMPVILIIIFGIVIYFIRKRKYSK